MEIKKRSTIVFLGDCITGANRNTTDSKDVGNGYVSRINDALKNYRINVINCGIDESKSIDLLNRYEQDVLANKPDVVTIYIGMNDVWHHYTKDIYTSNEEFENNIKTLLDKIKNDLNIPIILIEPFIIDITKEHHLMREELWQKVDILRKLARQYADEYIALDGSFASACIKHDINYYTLDGVHPTDEGHKFIARRWLRTIIVDD